MVLMTILFRSGVCSERIRVFGEASDPTILSNPYDLFRDAKPCWKQ